MSGQIGKSAILGIVHKTLSPDQLKASFVYWDSRIRPAGEAIQAGPLTLTMPFDGMLVFVDLAPRYNWAHPCLCLMVDLHDLHVHVAPASFTPYMHGFPDTVTIVLRYGQEPPHGRYFRISDDVAKGGRV